MKKIEITLHDDGNVEAQGPVDNKVLCYGMLECAKDIIHDYGAAKASAGAPQNGILRPGLAAIRQVNGSKNGGH